MYNIMAQPQESNLMVSINTQSFSSTDIHIWRMRVAVLWSIIIQVILLFVFILFINIDIFHPLSWIGNCFHHFLSLSIWVKLFILVFIIYIQGEVCKKDYVNGAKYQTTRFQKIRHIFSVRNLLLLFLHMVIGITVFWIYSSIVGKTYESLTKQCGVNVFSTQIENCLVESKLFILIGGLWLGVYYFAHDYMFGSRTLSFPLIQQYKLYRVKAALKATIKHSVKNSVMPSGIFLILYYFYGGFVRTQFTELFSYKLDDEPIDSVQGLMNIWLIISLWLFSSVFIVTLKIMELLFNVYLTEHCIFPVTTTLLPPGNYISLMDSLKTSNVPILHHLGYLDLFMLSSKCQQRREEIFTLSHPGGHPHSWNNIVQECSNLIKTFTNDLNQALNKTLTVGKGVTKSASKVEATSFHFHCHNIRKLTSPLTNKDVTTIRQSEHQSGVEIVFSNIQIWLNLKLEEIYKKPYIAYFFAESPDSRINYLLCQCQSVIWAVQSLSFLTAASLSEDRYGIVQKDLADIIVMIVSLKQVLDKLFKQNLIVKKSFSNDPLDVQMKYLLKTSVKRSLYKIAVTFGPYIKDLGLPVDTEVQMNNYIAFKEV